MSEKKQEPTAAVVDEKIFADYLRAHPDFFQRHASLVGQLVIPHPNTGRAISLVEKQVMVLRDQLDATQKKLRDLVGNARANDRLAERVEGLSLHLLGQRSFDEMIDGLPLKLKRLFDLEYVRLVATDDDPQSPEIAGIDEATCLSRPTGETMRALFGNDAADVRSCAVIPLSRDQRRFAILAMGSSDPQRYEPGAGTRYLLHLQRLLSASLTQLEALTAP
jgi:uncharacterized protein YigA (DUF484 family)